MTTRLDLQRPPALGRTHKRLNARLYVRGYEQNPHAVWGDTQTVSAQRSSASPSSVYFNVETITAQDATNAARLAGLGFIANPQSAWTTGQSITVNTFLFNWSGSAWAAGAHA
jgi:hypothetical protein